MKIEMTERDKKLLVMLSIFVIVVCIGYWGVYPVIKDIKSMNKDIEKQQTLKDENELKMTQVIMLEVDNEKLEEDIVEARSMYYPMMNSAEIDKYITDMILSYGLYSYDLSISFSEDETDLQPYKYSSSYSGEEGYYDDASYGDYDELLGTGDDKDETDIVFEDEPSTGIFTVSLNIRLGGDYEKLKKLLNDLQNTDRKLRVVSYSWSEERSINYIKEETESELGEYEIVTERVLTIGLEMYMCEE